MEENVRLLSPDIELTEPLKRELTGFEGCNDRPCALLRLDENRLLLVHNPHGVLAQSRVIDLASLGEGRKRPARATRAEAPKVEPPKAGGFTFAAPEAPKAEAAPKVESKPAEAKPAVKGWTMMLEDDGDDDGGLEPPAPKASDKADADAGDDGKDDA